MKKWSLDRKLETSRRNHARRCYKKAPLLALLLIRERYPDYSERQLLEDLKRRTPLKVKAKKTKTRRDFRYCQISKLAVQLHAFERGSSQYNKTCNQLSALMQADKERRPITVHVVKPPPDGKVDYYFKWNTDERYIIEFITLANKKSVTHDQLCDKKTEIQRLMAGLLAG